MEINGINHITLAVSDLDRSVAFYRDILGFRLRALWPAGAYFDVGGFWFCLSVNSGGAFGLRQDYTHLAFSCAREDFAEMADLIRRNVLLWQENRSEGDSVYFLDPDGHKLELHVGDMDSRIQHYKANPVPDMVIFD